MKSTSAAVTTAIAANAVDLTENSSSSSIQNAEKKTYTQALQTDVLQSSSENETDLSILQKLRSSSVNSARSKSRD